MRSFLLKSITYFSLGAIALSIVPRDSFSKNLPASPAPSFVYSESANVDVKRLNQALSQFQTETGTPHVVALFASLEGEDVFDFSNRLFQSWKIGQQGANNGLLLTVFLKERKIRYEVGYGLEDRITDAKAKRLITEVLGPEFKQGRIENGILNTLPVLKGWILKTGSADPLPSPKNAPPFWVFLVILLVPLSFIVMISILKAKQAMTLGHIQRSRREQGLPPLIWTDTSDFGFRRGRDPFGGSIGGGSSQGGGFFGGGGMSGGGGASGDW